MAARQYHPVLPARSTRPTQRFMSNPTCRERRGSTMMYLIGFAKCQARRSSRSLLVLPTSLRVLSAKRSGILRIHGHVLFGIRVGNSAI